MDQAGEQHGLTGLTRDSLREFLSCCFLFKEVF